MTLALAWNTLAGVLRRPPSLTACVPAALLLLISGGGNAMAQNEGVHLVDPDSPAGQQYKLPLEDARRDAAGGVGSADRSGGQRPPLFGAGLSRRAPSGEDPVSPDVGKGNVWDGGARSAHAARDGSARSALSGERPSGTEPVAASGTDLSAGMLTALMAFGVLLVGVVVGFSIRALRGTHQPT